MSDELNKYPGNLKHHKVDKEGQRKLLCDMMDDDAKSGLYDMAKREPLLSDDAMDDMRWLSEDGKPPRERVRDFYEAARAKDAELIQRLLNDMQDFVDRVDNGEARSKRSYAAFKHSIEIAAAAGYKPTQSE